MSSPEKILPLSSSLILDCPNTIAIVRANTLNTNRNLGWLALHVMHPSMHSNGWNNPDVMTWKQSDICWFISQKESFPGRILKQELENKNMNKFYKWKWDTHSIICASTSQNVLSTISNMSNHYSSLNNQTILSWEDYSKNNSLKPSKWLHSTIGNKSTK